MVLFSFFLYSFAYYLYLYVGHSSFGSPVYYFLGEVRDTPKNLFVPENSVRKRYDLSFVACSKANKRDRRLRKLQIMLRLGSKLSELI